MSSFFKFRNVKGQSFYWLEKPPFIQEKVKTFVHWDLKPIWTLTRKDVSLLVQTNIVCLILHFNALSSIGFEIWHGGGGGVSLTSDHRAKIDRQAPFVQP